MYYRNADIILIIFDVMERASFTKAKELINDLR